MSEFFAMLAAHVPALILMILGYALIITEMYLPGFGLPGISGTVMLVLGIVFMQPTAPQALILVLISVVFLALVFIIVVRSLSKGRLSRSPLVLNDSVNGSEENTIIPIGTRGTAQTLLRPAGIGLFDSRRLNVVSDGEFIEANADIEIVSIDGNRILVRKIEGGNK
ncbi:MAG: hypothetical protein MJ099_01405 [Clostridia bacterium]|nr:hypothetical protein [Clostridia bacterium]